MRDLEIAHFLQWDLALPRIKHIIYMGALGQVRDPVPRASNLTAKILGGRGSDLVALKSEDINPRNLQLGD